MGQEWSRLGAVPLFLWLTLPPPRVDKLEHRQWTLGSEEEVTPRNASAFQHRLGLGLPGADPDRCVAC